MYIDKFGIIDHKNIIVRIFINIEGREMGLVNGIVIHQTNSSTAQSTFNSYGNKEANGAHFLIDKDGTIYQTASIYKTTRHVGKMQSRCMKTLKCSPVELKAARETDRGGPTALTRHEVKKPFPEPIPPQRRFDRN